MLRSFWNGFLRNCINTLLPAPRNVAFQFGAAEGLRGQGARERRIVGYDMEKQCSEEEGTKLILPDL